MAIEGTVSGSIRWETGLEAGGGAFCSEGGQRADDRFGAVLTHDRRGGRRAAVGPDRQDQLSEAGVGPHVLMRMSSGVVGSPDENGTKVASGTLSTRTFSSSPKMEKAAAEEESPSCRGAQPADRHKVSAVCVHEPGT